MINQLYISNYKSIKHLSLACSRINVLIGEPNTGKSNILEALDLSYLSWMFGQNETNKAAGVEQIDLKSFFRIDSAADLFHFGNFREPIRIAHSGLSGETVISFNSVNDKNSFELFNGSSITTFDINLNPAKDTHFYASPIVPFRFKEKIELHDEGNYLDKFQPPFGNNLIEVIRYNENFREFISDLLDGSGIELNLDILQHKIFIQTKLGKSLVYSGPYNSLADTFRRIIFYVGAIRYNNAFVITLEEPDTHAFPKYVSYLADEIIQAYNKQFFIATHNPYLLNNLIENTPEGEIAVFVCNKDNTGTKAKKLSTEELSELLDNGIDIFFNINNYLDDSVQHHS